MNIININEEEKLNKINNDKDSFKNIFEIDLLDTINKKDIFKNIRNNLIKKNYVNKRNNNNKEFHCITDNYQLDVNEIASENSNFNKSEENSNKISADNNDLKEVEDKNGNYLDFKTFMAGKTKEKPTKIIKNSKSFKSNKVNRKKTFTPFKKNNFNKNLNLQKEEEKEKIKYTKERLEMNKKRINNLYNDYQKILNIRKKRKEELSKEEIKDCSFSPEINKNSKKLIANNIKFSKPIFLRYNKDKTKKNNLAKKYALNLTHIPKINKKFIFKIHQNDIKKKKDNSIKIKVNDIKNKKTFIKNNIIEKANILRRQLLLDEYINQHKIGFYNNNDNISYIHNTSTSYKTQSYIKRKREYTHYLNKSQNYPVIKKLNLEKKLNNNNRNKNKNNKKNRTIFKNKSFNFDYIKGINKKIDNNINLKTNNTHIISIDNIDKYYKNNRTFINSNHNNKENVEQNYINKINENIYYRNNSKGICYNITEQCINIKNIALKSKKKFRIFK